MLLFGCDQMLARWAGDRLGIADFSPCTVIGVAHDGEIVAAAIYNNYRAAQHRHHVRDVVAALGQPGSDPGDAALSVRAVALRAHHGGDRRAQCAGAGVPAPDGFRPEGFHADALPNADAVSYGLLAKDAARWIA